MLKSISRISGTLRFKGSWNAATNTPTLVSSVGTEGDVWIVSVAGNTDLNGTSNWGVDDWAVFLDGAWRRVEGGADGNFVNLTVTGVAEFADGSEAAPSITNIGDTDTGAYFPADNTVALTANAQEKLRVGATEVVVNDKGYDVDFRVEGDTDANLFVANAGSDNVGIGTSAPVAKLDVRGSAVFNEDGLDVDFRVEGDADANLVFVNAGTDKVGIGTATPPEKFSVLGNSSLDGAVTVNDTGAAVDFRVETDGDANAIFAQGSSNNVGFGTNTPSAKIDVSGTGRFANGVTVNDLGADSDTRIEGDTDDHLVFVDASTDQVGIGLSSMTAGYKLSVGGNLDVQGRGLFHTGAGTHYIDVGSDSTWAFSMSKNTSAGLLLGTRDATDVIITVNSELPNPISPNLFIDGSTGYVGISTNAPGSELDVKGTLRLSGSTSGYVGLQGAAAAGSTTYTLPAADGSSGQILTTDGAGVLSWTGAGTSSVFGPASSTDEALVRWDGASGSLVQNSNALLTDAGRLTLSEGMWVNFLSLDADTIISTSGDAYTLFVDGGTNNVGIGTGTPTQKLSVNSGAATTVADFASTGSSAFLGLGNSGAITYIGNDSTSGNFIIQTPPGSFSTKLTLDPSGNLGLGVTPSAWGSNYKAIESEGAASFSISGANVNGVSIASNAYATNSGWLYKTTGTAAYYAITLNDHLWYNAPSGTAGNPIPFTLAMRLDASGNLGIGTSSPTGRIDATASSDGIEYFSFRNSNSGTSAFARFRIGNSGSENAFTIDNYGSNHSTKANITEILNQFNAALVLGTSGTERARITSGGTFAIGVTPSAWTNSFGYRAMQIGGVGILGRDAAVNELYLFSNAYNDGSAVRYIYSSYATQYQQYNGGHFWLTAPSGTAGNAISFTQAMSLTSAGNLLVGTTSNSNSAKINTGGASGNEYSCEGKSSGIGVLISFSSGASGDCYYGNVNNTGQFLARWEYQGGGVGAISTNGTNTTYGTSSDVRLKNNIVSAPDSGSDIDAIKIVSFNWKSNNSKTKYGLIAQELIAIAPDAVQQGDDGEEVERAWGVDYSKLVPMLVKEIQSLRARVAALEAK